MGNDEPAPAPASTAPPLAAGGLRLPQPQDILNRMTAAFTDTGIRSSLTNTRPPAISSSSQVVPCALFLLASLVQKHTVSPPPSFLNPLSFLTSPWTPCLKTRLCVSPLRSR